DEAAWAGINRAGLVVNANSVGGSRRCDCVGRGPPREFWLLQARFFKLETRDAIGARRRLALGEVLKSLPHPLVIPLPVIAAAEIFIEQPSQRPQVLSAVLAAHYNY